jgi:hypothetical protein
MLGRRQRRDRAEQADERPAGSAEPLPAMDRPVASPAAAPAEARIVVLDISQSFCAVGCAWRRWN